MNPAINRCCALQATGPVLVSSKVAAVRPPRPPHHVGRMSGARVGGRICWAPVHSAYRRKGGLRLRGGQCMHGLAFVGKQEGGEVSGRRRFALGGLGCQAVVVRGTHGASSLSARWRQAFATTPPGIGHLCRLCRPSWGPGFEGWSVKVVVYQVGHVWRKLPESLPGVQSVIGPSSRAPLKALPPRVRASFELTKGTTACRIVASE